MPDAPRRPTPVTLACLFVGFSAVLLVLNLMTVLGDWGSLDMQEGLKPVLETEPISGTELTMDQLLAYLRIAAQVVVALSIAAGVFAIYTARGHEPSRWILTVMLVLGALLFVLTGVAGILPGALALLCATTLWSRDARRWFALKNGRPVPPTPAQKAEGATAVPHHPSQPAAGGAAAAPTAQLTATGAPAPATPPAGPARRPGAVEAAVWTAFGTSALVAAMGVVGLLAFTVGADVYRQALEEPGLMKDFLDGSGMSIDEFFTSSRYMTIVWIALGSMGALAALWARTGRRAGRLALIVMCGVTIATSLVFTVAGVPTIALAVLVLVLLNRQPAKAWFAARSSA